MKHAFPMMILAMLSWSLAACGASSARVDNTGALRLEPGAYAEAFDRSQAMLRDMGFEIDRTDSRAGIITTLPKRSLGLIEPWDSEQTTLREEWRDFTNRQQRVASVRFRPADEPPMLEPRDPPGVPHAPEPDLREFDGPILARFEVVIERLHRAGRRIETESVFLSTRSINPADRELGIAGEQAVPVRLDSALSARLAEALASTLGARATLDVPPPPPERPRQPRAQPRSSFFY